MNAIRTRPEPLYAGVLLAAVGGFLDAYTFVTHGVFANAQTGNVVLIGVEGAARHWRSALLHVVPLVAFLAGLTVAEALGRPAVRRVLRRPTRVVLAAEILVLAVVGALPARIPSDVVTVAVAFVAALQVATFQQLGDVQYSTTVTTGNLRTLVTSAFRWRAEHDATAGRRAARLAAVVAGFAAGVAVGAVCTDHLHARAAWVAAAALVVVLVAFVRETAALERR